MSTPINCSTADAERIAMLDWQDGIDIGAPLF